MNTHITSLRAQRPVRRSLGEGGSNPEKTILDCHVASAPRNDESGNALWMILIAIVLLAALTMMLSRSSDTSSDTGDYEQRTIHATKILRYAASIELAVKNLKQRDCSENDISFWHDSDGNGTEDGSDDYYNANSPTDHSCHVFEPEGAGQTYKIPDAKWLDSSKSALVGYGEFNFGLNFLPSVGQAGEEELTFVLPALKRDICLQLNSIRKVDNPADEPPEDNTGIFTGLLFTGAFSLVLAGGNSIGDSGSSTAIAATKSACIYESVGCVAGGCYDFYHVLLTR